MEGLVDQNAVAVQATQAGVVLNHPKAVDYVLGEAFRHLRAKEGPFVLNLPQDIQAADVPIPDWSYHPQYKAPEPQPPVADDVEAAANMIAASPRTTLIRALRPHATHHH